MTEKQFRNEQGYLRALSAIRAMLNKGLLTSSEYEIALEILKNQFSPPIDASLIVSST